MNKDKNSISEIFDQVMSESVAVSKQEIPMATNINKLIKKKEQIIIPEKPICNNNVCKLPKLIPKPKFKPKLKLKPRIILKQPTKDMFDISKKAIIGSLLYIILSLPILVNLFPNNSDTDQYKNIMLRALIFSIIFVLIAKFL